MKKVFLLACLVLNVALLNAQKETYNWFFGQNAGISFSTTPPTPATGALFAAEGTTSMSDTTGNLLFYTDGVTVYNQVNGVMSNGTGLMGSSNTVQSAIALKQPGNPNIYFIFTLSDEGSADGLRYSIVDMSLAAGMGSVTVKNIPLASPCTEQLSASLHCNGTDIWVVSHALLSNNYLSFLLTSAGVNTTPVVSTTGSIPSSTNKGQGTIKISPTGRQLAATFFNPLDPPSWIELYDFDPSTGVVSNSLSLSVNNPGWYYGCEFSPDGSKLYSGTWFVNNTHQVFQWDLCSGTPTTIVASETNIPSVGYQIASLQLGPDGRIYIAHAGTSGPGVIGNPDVQGAGCNYSVVGQSLNPNTYCMIGLPNFIKSAPKRSNSFTYSLSCNTASFYPSLPVASLCVPTSYSVAYRTWNFGDPASSSNNTSTTQNATHVFSGPGTYTVQLVLSYNCGADTIRLPVNLTQAPNVSVSGNFSVCAGAQSTYTASGGTSYLWSQPGYTTPIVSLSPSVTTGYTVTATATNSCTAMKTFTIAVLKCTSIPEEFQEDISVYPNPVYNTVNFNCSWCSTFEIVDMMGKTIYEKPVNQTAAAIDVSFLAEGCYWLNLSGQNRKITTRLIKISN